MSYASGDPVDRLNAYVRGVLRDIVMMQNRRLYLCTMAFVPTYLFAYDLVCLRQRAGLRLRLL